MGASASVSARDAAPSTTCRICLLSSQDQQPVAAGEGDIHSWPATEVPRLADGAVEDCAQCSRAHFLMEDQIISPCDCSGTQQHVHLHCLLRWIALQPSRGANCEVCNAKFRGLVVDVLADPSMQSFFRIHRTLFACCTTNNRYDRAHSAALSLQMKIDLMSFMRAGGAILQTTSRASTFVELEGMSSEGSAASQLLVLLLASRRKHWNSSAFLIIFSRPRAASDGSTALIAVNITQQQQLRECPAALEFHRTSGVPCTLFRGGPCKSNTPIAVLSVQAAGDWHILFQKAKAVYHPNLVHTWQTSEPFCCFYSGELRDLVPLMTAALSAQAGASNGWHLSVFIGHAVWSSQQLLGEVARGDWALSCADHLPCARDWFKFTPANSSALWSQVWRKHQDRLIHCSGQAAQNSEAAECADAPA